MVPQLLAVGALVEFGDAHAVLVGGDVFGHDVHGDLGQIEIAADAGSGGDAGFRQYFLHQAHGQLVGGEPITLQIGGGVDENLVDRIDMDVLGGDVSQIDVVDAGAVGNIESHAGRGGNIVDSQFGMRRQHIGVNRFARKTEVGRLRLTGEIHFTQPLHHFEESRPSADAVGFE